MALTVLPVYWKDEIPHKEKWFSIVIFNQNILQITIKRLHKYVLSTLKCHWKASASWTRRSVFPASGLVCVQSERGQTLPTRDEQTDQTSAGFHLELEVKGREEREKKKQAFELDEVCRVWVKLVKAPLRIT